MAAFDDQLSRLVKEHNALGGGASLPAIERDAAGKLELRAVLARVLKSGGSGLIARDEAVRHAVHAEEFESYLR